MAILILATGHFYYKQTKGHILKEEEFSLIEFARHIKMEKPLGTFSKDFHYSYVIKKGYVDIRNFHQKDGMFIKLLPTHQTHYYLQVTKSTQEYEKKLFHVQIKIITIQIILLIIFAAISFYLAKRAIYPLEHSLKLLDSFIKDLIHDLNTPITAMKLNLKLLKKDPLNQKALVRVDKSVENISELHKNLKILLEEETFLLQSVVVSEVIQEIIDTYSVIYPNIQYTMNCEGFVVKSNYGALKQILQNIISNSSKYNKAKGFVHIFVKDNKLYIEDSGKGLEDTKKIFQRGYSTQQSSGFGLDIASRLAQAMKISIHAYNNQFGGATFVLDFYEFDT